MDEVSSARGGVSGEDRADLVRFFRSLNAYAVLRLVFIGLVTLVMALPFLPRILGQRFYPLPSYLLTGWGFVVPLFLAVAAVGLAAILGGAIECAAVAGYRGHLGDAALSRLAQSARLWLMRALGVIGAFLAFMGLAIAGLCDLRTDHHGTPGQLAVLAAMIATLEAVGVAFALWHRRLAQLCAAVTAAYGATFLANSARWAAGTWLYFAISLTAAILGILLLGLCGMDNRFFDLSMLVEACFVFMGTWALCGLILVYRALRAAAALLARVEDE